MTVLRTRET